MVTEKIELVKFDQEEYLKDAKGVYAQVEDIQKVADEITAKKYKNIFLLGIGGTWAEFSPSSYIFDKLSDLEVHLVNAAEFNTLRHRRLGKDSLVITASASGNTKEIIDATTWLVAEDIDVIAFTNKETALGKIATQVVESAATTGECEFLYYQLNILTLRLIYNNNEFPQYDKYISQTKNIFEDLIEIRKKFEPKADEIAKKYHAEPYNIWVGSGILWGETYLFSMCILEEMQWVRTKSITSPEFFHGTLELVEKGVPVFLLKGEDEYRELDARVEKFARQVTEDLVVFDTAEYALNGVDEEFRYILSPLIATSLLTERLSKHFENYTKHNLAYRRYYRQFDY